VALTAGSKLGPYEILAPLGAGGMGEVYRARDPRLGREVAVKILPEAFSQDPARLARFDREARSLAALNHPGIAGIHGIEEADSGRFLVLELVEGETLAARLSRGPLPVEEALAVCRQIAEALEVAHEKGLIHRDLKPGNVMVTPDEKVKLLDFGLAKGLEGEPSDSDPESPTLPRPPTGEGVILGTAAYMSPEQARGKPLDKRTDIWSFGCVLYEALTGRRAFGGESVSDSLAAVLDREPDWEALPATTPVPVRTLLTRCLRKEKAKRLHDIADAQIEIEEALADPVTGSSATLPLRATALERRLRASWAVGGLVIAVAMASLLAWWALRPTPAVPHTPQRLSIVPSRVAPIRASGNTGVLALSPDGTQLVYVARVGGKAQLYLRPVAKLEATPIPGAVGLTPFFSPDGQWVGFHGMNWKLMKVSLQGGQPITICDASFVGASWGEDDTIILVARSGGARLLRVSANGGTPEVVTTANTAEGEKGHNWPQILPGGKAVLFTIQAPSSRHDECRIAVLSLETGTWRVLIEGGSLARYVPSGHVIYARYGSLLAVPFDLKRLEVTGAPTLVLEDVAMHTAGSAYLAVSRTGSLAYVRRRYAPPERSLVWVDRLGDTELVAEDRRAYGGLRLAPDGTRLAVTIRRFDGADVFVYDLHQKTWTRLTFEKSGVDPVWSPDGRWLAFSSKQGGAANLYRVPADGSGTPERLRTSTQFEYAEDWSPDGRFLLFNHQPGGQSYDLWFLPFEEGAEASPYIATPFTEEWGQFSPDGHCVATESNESGRYEVYLRSFPDAGRKWAVSTAGGEGPLWSPDGRELFFRSPGGKRMMVAAVHTVPTCRSETPRVLFDDAERMLGFYDIASDGRFLAVLDDAEEPEPEQIVVIPDFAEELKAKFREAGQ